MPRPVRIAVLSTVATLLLAGAAVWAARGPAILLDLATGTAGLLCF